MHFAYDPDNLSYYYGDMEPTPGFARKLLFETSHQLISVDVETISLKERIAVGVGISIKPNLSFYFQLFPNVSPAVPWHLLRDTRVTKVYHNNLFDLSALREYDVDTTTIMDTNLMSRLLCYKYNSLLDLCFIHQMEVHDMKDILAEHNAKTTMELPSDVVARKCMQDSGATLQLYCNLWEDTNKEYLATEMQVVPILIEMSNKGLQVDQEMRQQIEDELDAQAEFYQQLCEEVGFNPGSHQQVAYMLAKRGAYSVFTRLPFTKGRRGSLSTAREVLERMDDVLASIVLRYRDYTYLLSHYIRPWAKEDRTYTRFHMDAATGRPSSTDRNMQNIPGKKLQAERGVPNCRNILLPDSGIFTDMDWSQLELRILAYLSQDREMLHIFETGGDIHQTTADFLGIPRSIAKNVNFALVYGATDETLMETAHIRSLDKAKQLRQNTFQLYTGVGDWIDAQHHEALRTYRARTLFGRNLRLPTEEEERIDGIQRKAVNYPIQGSAAEILKRGLIICKDLPLSLQVHDELLCDGFVPDYKFKPLEEIAPFHTPVEVKYLERWE